MLYFVHPLAASLVSFMKNQLFGISSLIALSVPVAMFTIATDAQAIGVIRGSTATTDMGTFTGAISNITNQSGLSATYTSGTTDFDSYVSSTTNSGTNSDYVWQSTTSTGFVTFDLGASYDLNALALWPVIATNVNAVRNFTLYADTDADTSTLGTSLGNFTAVAAVGGNLTIQSQVFNFNTTNTRYIQMNVTSNAGGTRSGLQEVAFAQPVPWETDALSVIGTTLLFAGGVWKKRKSTKPLDKE
jgi:hypothetical protein